MILTRCFTMIFDLMLDFFQLLNSFQFVIFGFRLNLYDFFISLMLISAIVFTLWRGAKTS